MGRSGAKKPQPVFSFLCAVAAALVFFCAHPAAAEPAGVQAATDFASTVENTSLKFVTDTTVPRALRAERVREVLARDFDVGAIARFALGTHWGAADEAQRAEYMKLFEEALVQQYTLRLESFEGMTVEAVEAVAGGRNDFIITREAHHTDGMVVGMEWRIREKEGEGFRIVDLSVLGISMGVTLRGEFAEIIQRGGGNVEALLHTLRKRTKTVFAQKD